MNPPSISLKRSLDFTIKDTYLRIDELGDKESQALREEFKEWIDACEGENIHPHILYINQIK